MSTDQAFDNFLEQEINLNSTRLERIVKAEKVLSDFIKNNNIFSGIYKETIPQGSYRHKTIIKPIGKSGTFDVDLLIILDKKSGWSAKDYLLNLSKEFKNSGRYDDITDTRGKNRAVTINYEGDFHVDLVPGIKINNELLICNKSTNEFEKTDGDGYALWFDSKNIIANSFLIPTVRILKYLRDKSEDFDTKSIILTTIIGMQVEEGCVYHNLPSAFSTLVQNLHVYLEKHENPPSIINPAMPGENFDRHWKGDNEGFRNLKRSIKKYAVIAQKASQTGNDDEAIKVWKEIFGESFGSEKPNNIKVSGPAIKVGAPFIPNSPWLSTWPPNGIK